MPITTTPQKPIHNAPRYAGKIVEQMRLGFCTFAPDEVWTPNVNLYETERSYLVCVDLAGVDQEKIEVTFDCQVLILHGAREMPHPPDGNDGAHRTRVHLMEIDHGAFSRAVELPADVSHDKIQARYSNGLLWIELPKK